MTPVPLSDACDLLRYGGKAAQLGAAIKAGLPVPEGFGLDYEFVGLIVGDDPNSHIEVGKVCAQLPGPLAVRSSAIGEDSAGASFAGQHSTLLNVAGVDAAIDAIKVVWRSGRSDAAMAYRQRVGADTDVRVAVVMQKLVAADVAGVLFTCNPVTGADELVAEASWGLGEAIVQGLVIPDRYRMDRAGKVIETTAGFKDIAVRQNPDGATRNEAVAPELVEQLCLGATGLQALQELVARCDEVFGSGPHDIEWAMQEQKLYLLQLRPVTT